MITQDQLDSMLRLQDKLNCVVNPDWRSAGYPWHRAVMVEAVELLDHVGWKWWKKQEPDLPQARIELVDIWHFALSIMLLDNEPVEATYRRMIKAANFKAANQDLRSKIDGLVEIAACGRFDTGVFMGLMDDLGMTWDDLYRTYVAKNVLNVFRQDNGYKAGTYVKTWGGVEDNVVLHELTVLNPEASAEELLLQLGNIYNKVKAL